MYIAHFWRNRFEVSHDLHDYIHQLAAHVLCCVLVIDFALSSEGSFGLRGSDGMLALHFSVKYHLL